MPPCSVHRRNYLRLDRPTAHFFMERITATGVRTGDGDNADWYFLPIVLRKTSDGFLLNEAIRYVAQVHPWWNQTAGHRHFVFALGEQIPYRAGCGRPSQVHNVEGCLACCMGRGLMRWRRGTGQTGARGSVGL